MYRIILVLFLLQGMVSKGHSITIHTIGDSTMADYDENTTDKRGWGMMFQQFFTPDAIINNRAKSGASSKSFYLEAPYWATVKKQIKSGDYVLIQFAHNDEKNGGLDGDTVDPSEDYRGTSAQGAYKTYLRAYVNETRELGATPVLVTAMCRKYFSGGTITRTGRHDLGDNFGVPLSDHTYDYSYAMSEVANEMEVELIDVTSLTKSLFESYGDAACTSLLFCKDDSTHPNAMGGTLVARLVAQAMTNQNILAQYINASSDLLINPTSVDFGSAYVGQTLTKELTISGFDLTPASGTFTLSVSNGFTIAACKTDAFSSSIEMDYTNGNLNFGRFYISASQSSTGTTTGTLTVTDGNITKLISLSSSFIQLVGGTEVRLFWQLSVNSDYVLDGPAIPIEESFSNMYVQRYAAPNAATIWPEISGYDATRKTQRNLITGDAWPAGDIDEVSTRYIQFGISASQGTELNIDSIGLYISGAGGNGMRSRISYSTNNFADYKVIHEFSSMVANNMYDVSAIPVEKLTYGDTLLVRIYPWYSGASTGKTICLADVCIHGIATTATSIESIKTSELNASCFPVLTSGKTTLNYSLSDPSKVSISVNSLNGTNVMNYYKNELNSGTYQQEIDLSSLPLGIYLCSIITEKEKTTFKIIKN